MLCGGSGEFGFSGFAFLGGGVWGGGFGGVAGGGHFGGVGERSEVTECCEVLRGVETANVKHYTVPK